MQSGTRNPRSTVASRFQFQFQFQFRISALIVAASFGLATSSAFAQGEHARRAAVEIRVIHGDLHRLQAPDTLPIHKTGLKHRIHGGLAAMDMLLRLADQELGNPVSQYRDDVSQLTTWINNEEFTAAMSLLDQWESAYPLTQAEIISDNKAHYELGQKLHQQLCAACHDNPAIQIERPAYNLFDEATKLEPAEFLARLYLGVRGDSVTGIDNPLSDYEISALVHYYRNVD